MLWFFIGTNLLNHILLYLSFSGSSVFTHSNHICLIDSRHTNIPTSPSFRPKNFRFNACRSIREYVSRRYSIIPYFENSIHVFHYTWYIFVYLNIQQIITMPSSFLHQPLNATHYLHC